MPRPEILFYSDFPLGYHNPEAEERTRRLAARGFPVVYAEMIGVRNPRLRHVLGATRRRGRPPPTSATDAAPAAFERLTPRVLPPRHAPGLRELNGRWLARQFAGRLDRPTESIAWVRFPTPEVVRALDLLGPRLLVYEQVDDHRSQMNTPPLRRLFDAAERALIARAGVLFAWSEPIRARLAREHDNVVLAGPAVDVDAFGSAAQRLAPRPRHAVYVGGIDRRFDLELLAAVSRLRPDWTFEIHGPDPVGAARSLEASPNVHVPGPIAPAAVAEAIATAQVCLLPYRLTEFNETLSPLKLLEYLAGGRPVAATPIRRARELGDLVELGDGPEEFAAALERAAAADDDAARQRRREHAAPFSWESRIDQLERAVEAALDGSRNRSPR